MCVYGERYVGQICNGYIDIKICKIHWTPQEIHGRCMHGATKNTQRQFIHVSEY